MNQVLYIAAVTGKGRNIVTWDTKTWKRIGSKTVVRDTILALIVSRDGKLLACGTTQGDVFILNSASKQFRTVVRKAHLGFVTALSFSHDSRALASVSLDSSARMTLIEEKKEAGACS
ncbi:SEC12-like protein 2 [Quercus lobata]|uniref:SEC12-like protein 2 n=1 Tax=Quercus lobata TaxID=97700 RepID=UPI0012459855|nr:SEC12-like protein 2 [Quercus lobata]